MNNVLTVQSSIESNGLGQSRFFGVQPGVKSEANLRPAIPDLCLSVLPRKGCEFFFKAVKGIF